MVQVIKFFFEIAGEIIVAVIEGAFNFFIGLISPNRKHSYTSDFAPVGLLSQFNNGFCLTGTRSMTVHDSFSNCSVFGPSGSGKSSIVIIPTVFNLTKCGATMCIHDPSGEIYDLVSGYLAKVGYSILRLDFSSPDRSEGFNPLARCKTVSDIQKIAHLVVQNTVGDRKNDPFWDRSSEMLITLFARYLVFYAEPEYCTLANVLRLIETFSVHPKKVDRLIVATHDEEIISSYKAFITYGDKTLQSIVATARAALNLFSDPTVIRTTAVDTIDFKEFRKKKVALFICNPIQHIHYFKPISAVFFESLFAEIMSRIPKKEERAIFCLLDEAVTMRFSALSTVISNIRKYRAGIMLVVQDYQALVALYGPAEAHNVRTNTHAQVYLKNQPLETCRELESILGRFTYTDEKGVERIRLLMSADEIRTLQDEAIILLGNNPAIKATVTGFYNRRKLYNRSQLPPYEPPVNPLPETPPLLPFDETP